MMKWFLLPLCSYAPSDHTRLENIRLWQISAILLGRTRDATYWDIAFRDTILPSNKACRRAIFTLEAWQLKSKGKAGCVLCSCSRVGVYAETKSPSWDQKSILYCMLVQVSVLYLSLNITS